MCLNLKQTHTHVVPGNFNTGRASGYGCAARERWHTPRHAPHLGRLERRDPAPPRLPGRRMWSCALTSSAAAGKSHFVCLSSTNIRPQPSPGSVTSSSRGSSKPPGGQQAHPGEHAEPQLLWAQGWGTSALPASDPAQVGVAQDWSPHALEPPRCNRACGPHLLLGPAYRAPTDPRTARGRTATSSSRWRVSTTRGSYHLPSLWAVWVPVPEPPAVTSPGTRVLRLPLLHPWVDCARLPAVSGHSPPLCTGQSRSSPPTTPP